jgi:hypothetical protein
LYWPFKGWVFGGVSGAKKGGIITKELKNIARSDPRKSDIRNRRIGVRCAATGSISVFHINQTDFVRTRKTDNLIMS